MVHDNGGGGDDNDESNPEAKLINDAGDLHEPYEANPGQDIYSGLVIVDNDDVESYGSDIGANAKGKEYQFHGGPARLIQTYFGYASNYYVYELFLCAPSLEQFYSSLSYSFHCQYERTMNHVQDK